MSVPYLASLSVCWSLRDYTDHLYWGPWAALSGGGEVLAVGDIYTVGMV